jgi:capsular exopolysaccharide synthesis family protein
MINKKNTRTSAGETIGVERRRLITPKAPFAIKEAYVKLRTNLLFCMKSDKSGPCKVFAFTSAKPSEGKSLTAANVAISFGLLGKKTVIIDADLRKPTQRRLWRIESKFGLCDYLARISPLRIYDIEGLSLSVICTGTKAPNPSELLSSDRMKELIAQLSKTYDYIIIDTPPINTVADAQIASAYVDGVVLIVRSGETTGAELSMAIDSVKRAEGNLCGIVLNGIDSKSMKYSYRYKYHDKYGYKYSYKSYYGNKYSSYSSTSDSE